MAVPKKRTSLSRKKMRSANKGERFSDYNPFINENGDLQISHRIPKNVLLNGGLYDKKNILILKKKKKSDNSDEN